MNQHGYARKLLLLAFTLPLLSACQPTVHLMPAPVGYDQEKNDPFAHTPESRKGNTVIIAYATNRLPIGSKKSRFYGKDFDGSVRMGIAEVKIGSGENNWEEIKELSYKGSERKSDTLLTLSNTTEMAVLQASDPIDVLTPDEAVYFKKLNAAIDASPFKEITVYVHGANNNFYRTAAQAAQYRHFTGRQAIVTLFSWPSAESIVRYDTDIEHIKKTIPTFVRYLKFLAANTSARKINILAYSAGSTLTTRSLAVLGHDSSKLDRKAYRESLRLGAVYFAAPDTDFNQFVDEYRSYQDLVDSVTVTVNQFDSVLGIAREMHYARVKPELETTTENIPGKSRLGKPDISDITRKDADWLNRQTREANFYVIDVDPKTIPSMARGSHDYWYHNTWASTDALIDINLHAPPARRGLVLSERAKNNAQIWKFPADYDERIGNILEAIITEFKTKQIE